jgi:hypothetical protein
VSSNVFRNFCSVLQISPKHFKFYKNKSCLVFRGTQLSCWMAFQILSRKGWKTWSTAVFTVHQHSAEPRLCFAFLLKPSKKHCTAFVKVVEGSEIYNFPIHHFVHFYSTFWRKTQSKSRWPAENQRGRAPERRRRAVCSAGLLRRAPCTGHRAVSAFA